MSFISHFLTNVQAAVLSFRLCDFEVVPKGWNDGMIEEERRKKNSLDFKDFVLVCRFGDSARERQREKRDTSGVYQNV